jgi:hypothetical protein
LLYLCEPLAALCGQDGVKQWAELLNDPHRLAEFERRWAGPNPAPTEQTPGYDHS